MSDADHEAALNQVGAMIGELVLISFHAPDGAMIGSNGGELIDAKPLSPRTPEESMIFRVLGGRTFVLDREAFRGWQLDLDGSGVAGLAFDLGGAEVRLTRYAAIGLA